MIPIEKIPGGTISVLVLYISVIGVLLVISTIIRLKIFFFRKAFIPASLIAGILGLMLGPYVLHVIPADMMGSIGKLPSQLIVVVFACMFLGMKKNRVEKHLVHDVTSSVLWTWAASFQQFAIPCLLASLVFTPLMKINPLFGAVFEAGFAGGHGTASGMRELFKNPEIFNWIDGGDLAMTTATIGLLMGILGGIIIINYAVHKKYTKVLAEPISSTNNVEEFFAEEERKPAAYTTIRHDVIEPFAFHLGIIGIAILIGRALVWNFGKVFGYTGLPLFPFAMIGGWLLNIIIQQTSLTKLLDRNTFQRIQGMALEVLIVAAMASIKIPVVIKYWLPLLVTSMAILAALLTWMFLVCPHIFSDNWFELAITHYGVKTGVAAVGYMLLRTVDPKIETDAGTIYALGTPFTSAFIGGGLVTTAVPYLIQYIGALYTGLAFLCANILVFIVLRLFFWNKNAKAVQR